MYSCGSLTVAVEIMYKFVVETIVTCSNLDLLVLEIKFSTKVCSIQFSNKPCIQKFLSVSVCLITRDYSNFTLQWLNTQTVEEIRYFFHIFFFFVI